MENTEAVAVATNVHWIILQNLLRKPETHAHLNTNTTHATPRCKAKTREKKTCIPEHGGDHLPGEGKDADPDTGDGDGLQKLVKLVERERYKKQQHNCLHLQDHEG